MLKLIIPSPGVLNPLPLSLSGIGCVRRDWMAKVSQMERMQNPHQTHQC
jgi:hypothetical protein